MSEEETKGKSDLIAWNMKRLAGDRYLFVFITTTFAISVALKNIALIITHIFILILLTIIDTVDWKELKRKRDGIAEVEISLKKERER